MERSKFVVFGSTYSTHANGKRWLHRVNQFETFSLRIGATPHHLDNKLGVRPELLQWLAAKPSKNRVEWVGVGDARVECRWHNFFGRQSTVVLELYVSHLLSRQLSH